MASHPVYLALIPCLSALWSDTPGIDALLFASLSKAFSNETGDDGGYRDQMKKSRSNQAAECAKRARENAFLVGEIEELKRELKAVRGYKMPRRLTREDHMIDRNKDTKEVWTIAIGCVNFSSGSHGHFMEPKARSFA